MRYRNNVELCCVKQICVCLLITPLVVVRSAELHFASATPEIVKRSEALHLSKQVQELVWDAFWDKIWNSEGYSFDRQ